MSAVPAALVKAVAQLGDPAVLRVAVKSVAITLLIFAGLGAGLYVGFGMALEAIGWAPISGATVLFTVLVGALLGWLLFRLVAVAVLQFFADEIVAAVEARHYPALAAQAQPLPFHHDLAISLKGLGRSFGYTLLALPVAGLLAFTAIGPAVVLLGVNAVLLGRELTDMAWLRHCRGDEGGTPVPRGDRALLGLAIGALMLVPVANLLGPIIGAAAGTHLVLRRLEAR